VEIVQIALVAALDQALDQDDNPYTPRKSLYAAKISIWV
jgi:hypothetical protein